MLVSSTYNKHKNIRKRKAVGKQLIVIIITNIKEERLLNTIYIYFTCPN